MPQLARMKKHRRNAAPAPEIMGDNIRVGHPWAGIRFDAGLLKRPMATADAMIEGLMRHYGDLRLAALPERRGEIEQLRREIARVLVKGEGGIDLAKATGTSVRTLQRRLKDAAVNYSDLQDDVRKTLALNLLENGSSGAGGDRLFTRLLRSQRFQSRLPALGWPITGPLSPPPCIAFQSRRREEVVATRRRIDLYASARQTSSCGLRPCGRSGAFDGD